MSSDEIPEIRPLAAPQRAVLGAGDVHVWMIDPDFAPGPSQCLAVLDETERARAARFHFDRHRDEYVCAHWLVRMALSHYDARPPTAWRFAAEPGGRPFIADATPLVFNLTHAGGRSLVAVGRRPEIGIDLEHEDSIPRIAEVASRVFTPRERAAWRALPEAEAGRFALTRWTLKEAYAKARGLGIRLDFSSFGFSDDASRLVDIADDDRPRDWRVFAFAPWPRACATLAVRATPEEKIDWALFAARG